MANEQALTGVLVGAGQVTESHLWAWQRIDYVRIAAVVDPQLDRAQARAAQIGLDTSHAYTSFAECLATGYALDFADIATPPETHPELVALAVAHGLSMLVQKPFAHSLREARDMIVAADAAGVLLSINENWRWREWFRRIKRFVEQGALGRIVYARFFIHSDFRNPGSLREPHRFDRWGTIALFDWGIHHLDVLRFLFGMPEQIYCRMATANSDLNGDDHALVVLAFPDDFTAMLDLSVASYDPAGHPRRYDHVVEDFRIEGDQGTLALFQHETRGDLLRLTLMDGSVQEWPAYAGDPHDAYLQSFLATQQHFVDCLRSGVLPETHARDNFETLAMTLAAYQSAAARQIVDMDTFIHQDDA